MSRNTMSKLEKNKVRVEFRLQFHATHIPQTGWNNLFISIVPPDSSKAAAKTNKANVRNKSCIWVDPIYETTRLLQDPYTNQYEDKVYRLVVAMGTSRSSLLGEASINLSDYLDSSKPRVVALPLHGSHSEAILHVSVQLLTSTAGLRGSEALREVNDRRLGANADNDSRKLSKLDKATTSGADKADPRLGFKPNPKEIPSLAVESGLREGYNNSTADIDGHDGSSDMSGSLCGEKRYNSCSQEIDSVKSTSLRDMGQSSSSESPTMNNRRSDNPFLMHGTRNAVHQWGPQTHVNREMAIVYEENNRLKRVLEEANLSIEELKKEITSLQSFAVTSEQILAKEVSVIKAEYLRFKNDLEIVRNIKVSTKQMDTGHPKGKILPGLVSSETSSVDDNIASQEEFFKLLREVDESKAERVNLVRKMGQMECYYEATIQELKETQKNTLDELQNLRHEHSSCIYTLSSTKAQMEAMHQQLNNERLRSKELERKGATSEAALRRARMNYSISVNQLQKDLRVLSLQVLSMYETNDNLIGNALEASQSSFRDCEEAEIVSDVAESSNVDHSMQSQSRDVVLKARPDLKRSVGSKEDLYRKAQEDVSEMLLLHIYLDVYSVALHQALLEASSDSKTKILELAEQLELSCRDNRSLRLKLRDISEEVCSLREEKMVSISRSNDLAFENQTLEGKLKSISKEKFVLSKIIREQEFLVNEHANYKSMYESCVAENAKFAAQLEQVAADKHRLSIEVSLLQEEAITMKIKVNEYEKLQNMVDYIQERLENSPANGYEQVNDLLPHTEELNNIGCEKFMSVITRFNDKILQLTEEKKVLLNERDVACVFFANVKTEVETVKQEFENSLREMVSKVDLSSALAEKLQVDVVSVSNKIHDSSEKEEKRTQVIESLLSDFSKMEASLQKLTLENGDLVHQIMAVESLTDELEDKKSEIHELKQKNSSLTELLQYRIDESDILRNEVDNLKRIAERWQDESSRLKSIRDQLNTQILALNSELKDRDNKLAQFDHQKAELNQLKQQLLDVQSENRILMLKDKDDKLTQHQLKRKDDKFDRQEEELTHLKQRLSDVESVNIRLENQLSYAEKQLKMAVLERHGFSIASDVVQTVVVKQYKLHVEELLQEIKYFNMEFEETVKAELNDYAAELKECKEKAGTLEAKFSDDKRNKREIGELKRLLRNSQTEIEDLVVAKEELEIRSLVLCTTIDEMHARGRAEDKRNYEQSSFTSQESLRIAFLKEEYEIKLEEICHQLSISEKHGEEMLLKLQDALDDLERRKKREASQLKRNEQLAIKVEELEAELKLAVYDKSEHNIAYQQQKAEAEMDCSVMSLDCCKEEKYQLILSLQECNDNKRRLTNEVELLKEQLRYLKESTASAESDKVGYRVGVNSQNRPSDVGNFVTSSHLSSTAYCKEAAMEEEEDKQYGSDVDSQAMQGVSVSNTTEDLSDYQLKPRSLMSVIERLQKQLEQMESENTLCPGDENSDELSGEVSQRDRLHLVKVARELENMSYLCSDSSRSENIFGKWLTKTLQTKNSSVQFISHEGAESESFVSVNELIKDMLEMKEGYAAMETELKEMHERYSKLRLDFAEVEGERQKLVLMLKNVRSSKNLVRRSLTCSHVEHFSSS